MLFEVTGPETGDCRWTLVISEHRSPGEAAGLIDAALAATDGGPTRLWIREVDDPADADARTRGFVPYRDLWQLRCPLPATPSGLSTRAFRPDDLDEFIAVNNRAFAWHPEQGGLTRGRVEETMAEPWFDHDGFRLHHADGRLVGFCWTKIHHDTEPVLGEIVVIAVDPSHHGRGLGKPMTLAGLEWLSARHIDHGMLYVESDNHPANATYAALGFTRHHTDRAYLLDRP